MWCAFEGPPRIVRVQGTGEYVGLDDQRVAGSFPDIPGARGVVIVHADRISDSCGYAVPLYEFQGHRDRLVDVGVRRSPTTTSTTTDVPRTRPRWTASPRSTRWQPVADPLSVAGTTRRRAGGKRAGV